MADQILPLFPLNLVLYPEEQLNLHIFEPRYKQLVNECHAYSLPFGIPPVKDNKLAGIGTSCIITDIERIYDDGNMDIRILGKKKFEIVEFYNKQKGRLFPAADINFITDDLLSGDSVVNEYVLHKIRELHRFMNIDKEMPTSNIAHFSYAIAHHIGFSLDQEINLLGMHSESQRIHFIVDHLDHLLPTITELERLKERAALNGHFKNIKPPDIF